MKKLLTLAALMGAAGLSFGQGYILFNNTSSSATHISTNTVVGGALATTQRVSGGAGSYYFGLYTAPTTTTSIDGSLAGWTFSGLYATNQSSLGRISGNATTDGVNVGLPLANLAVVGWSASIGNNVQEALSWWNAARQGTAPTTGWFGISGVAANVSTGGGPAGLPLPVLFGTGAAGSGTIAGFGLLRYDAAPIPEPTTFALAGLAGAAMLIFRRRR